MYQTCKIDAIRIKNQEAKEAHRKALYMKNKGNDIKILEKYNSILYLKPNGRFEWRGNYISKEFASETDAKIWINEMYETSK